MKKEKGAIGCIGCGTSLGCFFPLALVLGLTLLVATSSYFDESYYWTEEDTWMVIVLAAIVMPALLMGILQAGIGIWGLFGFFDQDVTLDDLNLLKPIPPADEGQASDEGHG